MRLSETERERDWQRDRERERERQRERHRETERDRDYVNTNVWPDPKTCPRKVNHKDYSGIKHFTCVDAGYAWHRTASQPNHPLPYH